ncbi:hypothetical protein PENTCL1PPCAC_28240, partial [Pristionchus entomophagus]
VLLLVLHFVSSDILNDHLSNNVNISVHPCDDFFLHVCSQSVNETEFPFRKFPTFYKEIAEKYRIFTNSRNFAIMNDFLKMNGTGENKPLFNRTNYEILVRSRCQESDNCYRQEFEYFSNIYIENTDKGTDRLRHYLSRLKITSGEEILEILPRMVESLYDSISFESSLSAKASAHFYITLTTRLFLMEELNAIGVFDKIGNMKDDVNDLKELIIEKFKNTPWLHEKDELGLSLLPQFEDTIKDMVLHYDLDEDDRDLHLLRAIKDKFLQGYYQAKTRSTGIEALDILFSLETSFKSLLRTADSEERRLIYRVRMELTPNASYNSFVNQVAIFAPYIYPTFADNTTMNKNYFLFNTIGHEIFHSVVSGEWAETSDAFKNGMNCMNNHYTRMCDSYGKGSCKSGSQTFEEDGPDIEGMRINYEYFTHNYEKDDLEETVFNSELLSVTRDQAFFYLAAIEFCGNIEPMEDHRDVHSYKQVRVNGIVTQMHEFSEAFSCSPDQAMFADKEQTCHLFGPDAQ